MRCFGVFAVSAYLREGISLRSWGFATVRGFVICAVCGEAVALFGADHISHTARSKTLNRPTPAVRLTFGPFAKCCRVKFVWTTLIPIAVPFLANGSGAVTLKVNQDPFKIDCSSLQG